MPLIVVLATGGTIASRSRGDGLGAIAADPAASIVGRIESEAASVTVEPVDLIRKNSFAFTMDDLRSITLGIQAQLERPEVDGIVVTHGTDTMEESAFLADLVHREARPVVFTGAQLAADRGASDGPGNLRDAIAVAASPRSHGFGVLVSFGGDVFAARGIRKQRALGMSPFDAASSGPLGHVVDGRVWYAARPMRADSLPVPGVGFGTTRVDIALSYPGADGALVHAAVAAGAAGVVVAGAGTGNTTAPLVDAITEATAAGVVVALGSRTGGGPVHPLYGGGGAVDAVRAGAIPIGSLPLTQARILLALLLDQYPAETARTRLADFCAER